MFLPLSVSSSAKWNENTSAPIMVLLQELNETSWKAFKMKKMLLE
jgi:hypothetical protein